MASSTDISVVLSGGSTNSSASASIGGGPSSTPLTSGVINNLFDDIAPQEASDGIEDYRCIYIFNDSEDTVYVVKAFIVDAIEGGSEIALGIADVDDVQRITVTGSVTSGSFTISYEGYDIVSNYNADLSVWATNLQNAFNSIEDVDGNLVLRHVRIAAQAVGSSFIFDVYFENQDGGRSHPLLTLDTNALVPTPTITISKLVEGSPINTIASELDVDTTPPGGVVFIDATESNPVSVPKLGPSEGFPLWFKRSVPQNAAAVSLDGGTLRVTMNLLDPFDV